jgi:two-component system, OmpR family, phosphate regulon sensor histidine kinase PhoR
MRFKRNLSPDTWTLINSAGMVLVLTVIYIAAALIIDGHLHLLPLIITDAVVFLLSYLIYRYILKNFLNEKIRVIYKTIRTIKSPKGGKEKELDMRKDIISEVNAEVLQWAKDRTEEIDELKKMETYRREFIGNVSHELKTPLFNIQGYVLTLLEGGINDPSVNLEYLERTRKNIDRMISVVEDLDVIARLESGDLQLDRKKFDVAALACEVIDLLETKARKKNIQMTLRSPDQKPVLVEGDKERIRQVLINLVDNSLKYGVEGGKTKVGFFDMDENWLIEVTDNGIGIEEKDIPRLFERFFRVDKSRSREQGGSGLGLAIVKHIIEAHNQTINVRSTVGVGTTFAFTLKKG